MKSCTWSKPTQICIDHRKQRNNDLCAGQCVDGTDNVRFGLTDSYNTAITTRSVLIQIRKTLRLVDGSIYAGRESRD